MYKLHFNNRNGTCPALIPIFDECCNYYMDRGLHVEGKLFDEVGMVSPEIGDIKMSVREDNYEGWLVCDGRAISRETYSALFALIGIAFGDGDQSTTFNLPDARGRIPLGAHPRYDGSGSVTWNSTINNTGGSGAHNNMQPYWVFGNYFIYSGVKDVRKTGCDDSFPIQPCDD